MTGMNRPGMKGIRLVTIVLAAAALVVWGCDTRETDSTCTSPTIEPHLSPVNFGDLYPSADGGTPGGQTVPYEWTLLLMSKCKESVVVSKICIVGDKHNGVEGSKAFYIEGPEPATIPYDTEAAVRITYNPKEVNTDTSSDGKPDPDNVAIVVQSNAKNFPTLVVPMCARYVPAGTAKEVFECKSPLVVAAGQKDDTLCK